MSAPDANEIRKIERRMKEAASNLHKMESDIATALTVLGYDSDRRKNLLARHMAKPLADGESAAAAETIARSNADYDREFQVLLSQYELAQTTKKKYEAEHISWDTARSLLARQRATIETLPGTEE